MDDYEHFIMLENFYIQELKKGEYNKGDMDDHEAIAAIIRGPNKTVLMMDHIKHDVWTIPIGKVDPGDTVEGTLKKECYEEVGIKVVKAKLINSTDVYFDRKGKKIKVTEHLYDITKYTGYPKNLEPQKHRSIDWMTLEQIKKIKKPSSAVKTMIKYLEGKK